MPGPRGLPIVGYMPFLRPNHLHRQFTALAQAHGPIYKIQTPSKLLVVVSSPALAREVLRANESTFSVRPTSIAVKILGYGGMEVGTLPWGPDWAGLRKILVRDVLSNRALDTCRALRERAVAAGIREIRADSVGKPTRVFDAAFKLVVDSTLAMLWGGGGGADFAAEYREATREVSQLMGRPNVSDAFPLLAMFDLQGVQREAAGIEKKSKKLLDKFDEILSSVIEERLRAVEKRGGNGRKDFLQVLLDLNRNGGSDGESYVTTNQVKALLMDILVGGTDTTSTMLEWTMAQLVKHPDAMSKVYKELNEIVGQNDIVEESHLPNLTYLEAVIKETFRIHPALPLLVPRCPSRTCELGGYTIPKGTIVYLNAYALHTDPQLWEDPLEFKPDRFLSVEDDTKFDFQGNNFQFLPFGSGRRVCPGQPLAVNTLKYVLATLLHSFDWKLPAGTELELEDKFGIVIKKMNPLVLVPTPRLLNLELY
ncbi:unnamed protein product [Linum tenue]|uniref:Cytochrome P450 n=1 Tax=Linum tenue TaxID=586396 RepID=A0AAV0JUG7_9ROSI|nr:unnamed protein product [Linum tenue]